MRPPRPLHRAFQGDVGGRPQLEGTLGAETWRPPDRAGPTLREDGRLAADAAGGGPGDSAQMRPAARRRTGAADGGSVRWLRTAQRQRWAEEGAGGAPQASWGEGRRPHTQRPAPPCTEALGAARHRRGPGEREARDGCGAPGGPAASADGRPGFWGACRVGRRVGGESVNVP